MTGAETYYSLELSTETDVKRSASAGALPRILITRVRSCTDLTSRAPKAHTHTHALVVKEH